MKILNRPPKLQWIIRLFFPGYDFDKVVGFAFGGTIYTRFNPLPEYSLVHERVHLKQMRYSKFYAIIHFIRFVLSKNFRYKTELEAYRKEYRFLKRFHPKDAEESVRQFARVLAGEGKFAYVYSTGVDYETAFTDLTE